MTTPLVHRPTIVREQHNRHGDVTSTTRIVLDEAIVAPRVTAEPDNNRAMVVTGRTMYLPHGTDIWATDELELPGENGRWKVDGDPADWTHPDLDWAPGVEVQLERVTG